MRRKMLRFMLPLLAVAASVTGMLTPKEVNAAAGICNYYCIDPWLTCCFTCHWRGGSCVCPEFCSIDPL